jgi:hypothetical protein
VELDGCSNNVLNCLSLKAYTVVMINHDRLPCVPDLVSPLRGYQPMQISDQPRTWLRRVSTDSLVIRKTSPQTERNRLDDCCEMYRWVKSRESGNPVIVTWAGQAGSGLFPGNPSAKGAIELPARSWPRQRTGRKLTHKTRCGCVCLH